MTTCRIAIETREMATPPDHDPMALIERELVALRRNVEHELVTGLLHVI